MVVKKMKFRKPGKYNRYINIKKNDLIIIKLKNNEEYSKYLFLGFNKSKDTLELVPLPDEKEDISLKLFIHMNNVFDIRLCKKHNLLWFLHLENKHVNEAAMTIKNKKQTKQKEI